MWVLLIVGHDDASADATFLYVNNTIYGNVRNVQTWNKAGDKFKVALLNADRFAHGNALADVPAVDDHAVARPDARRESAKATRPTLPTARTPRTASAAS